MRLLIVAICLAGALALPNYRRTPSDRSDYRKGLHALSEQVKSLKDQINSDTFHENEEPLRDELSELKRELKAVEVKVHQLYDAKPVRHYKPADERRERQVGRPLQQDAPRRYHFKDERKEEKVRRPLQQDVPRRYNFKDERKEEKVGRPLQQDAPRRYHYKDERKEEKVRRPLQQDVPRRYNFKDERKEVNIPRPTVAKDSLKESHLDAPQRQVFDAPKRYHIKPESAERVFKDPVPLYRRPSPKVHHDASKIPKGLVEPRNDAKLRSKLVHLDETVHRLKDAILKKQEEEKAANDQKKFEDEIEELDEEFKDEQEELEEEEEMEDEEFERQMEKEDEQFQREMQLEDEMQKEEDEEQAAIEKEKQDEAREIAREKDQQANMNLENQLDELDFEEKEDPPVNVNPFENSNPPPGAVSDVPQEHTYHSRNHRKDEKLKEKLFELKDDIKTLKDLLG